MDKLKLIKDVLSQHPAYGVSRGWSEYTGGFVNSGSWHPLVVMEAEESELLEFLEECKDREKRQKEDEMAREEKNKTVLPNRFMSTEESLMDIEHQIDEQLFNWLWNGVEKYDSHID